MKIITLLNQKGGVGKTSSSVHIAAGLAIHGRRVLLIDSDAQAHSTIQLGLEDEPGVYDLIARDAPWKAVLRTPEPEVWAGADGHDGELYVVPSNMETRVIPMVVSDATILRERLAELQDWADVVVIDTSPTPSMLHTLVYVATDAIIYPTECEALSLNGLSKSIDTMERLNMTRRGLGFADVELLGVQPTMYDVRTNAHDYGLSLLTGKFKRKTWPAIPTRTIWRDAAFAEQTLFAYAPDHVATVETWAMVQRVEKGIDA